MHEMMTGCEARQTCTLNTGKAGSGAWEGRHSGSKVEGSNAQAEHTEARPQPLYCRQNRPAPSHQGTLNRDSEPPLVVLLIHNGKKVTLVNVFLLFVCLVFFVCFVFEMGSRIAQAGLGLYAAEDSPSIPASDYRNVLPCLASGCCLPWNFTIY